MFSAYLRRTFEKVEGLYEAFMDFSAKFPDEDACRTYVLMGILSQGNLVCQNCGILNHHDDARVRSFPCSKCKKLIWITAGTTFEQVEFFRPWVAAQHLMEADVRVNAFQLSRLLETHYHTAYGVLKTINFKLADRMPADAQTAPSAAFAAVFFRRSRETPAGCHPVEEERRAQERAYGKQGQKNNPNRKSSRRRSAQPHPSPDLLPEMSGDEQKVFSFIGTEPIHFDRLCELSDLPAPSLSVLLMSLQLKNAVRNEVGNRYMREDFVSLVHSRETAQGANPANSKSQVTVKAILKHIRGMYQGISRKYLQLYVANFLFYEQLEEWKDGGLLKLLITSKKVKYEEILAFVTDLHVSVVPTS